MTNITKKSDMINKALIWATSIYFDIDDIPDDTVVQCFTHDGEGLAVDAIDRLKNAGAVELEPVNIDKLEYMFERFVGFAELIVNNQ